MIDSREISDCRALAARSLTDRLCARGPADLEILMAEAADYANDLYPEEAAAVAHAVTSRRHEFSTGRWLARRAMARIGLPARAIPAGPSREPQWPAGVAASITHSEGYCVVAMTSSARIAHIGIDIELSPGPGPELGESILAAGESAVDETAEGLRLTFSAKEAVFKAVFALYQDFIDYTELAIEFDRQSKTFAAIAKNPLLERLGLDNGSGIYESSDDGVVTLFTL